MQHISRLTAIRRGRVSECGTGECRDSDGPQNTQYRQEHQDWGLPNQDLSTSKHKYKSTVDSAYRWLSSDKYWLMDNKQPSCCCDSRSYCTYSYRLMSGIAVVSMSVYLFTVSNKSLLFFCHSILANRCFVAKWHKSVWRSKQVPCWEHDGTTFNALHQPWAPQCTAIQTDRQTERQHDDNSRSQLHAAVWAAKKQ